MRDAFEDAVDAHDRALADAGLVVWLGMEPTFTDASSSAPEWIGAAEGGTKLDRALGMLRRLHTPGALTVRTLGRQYPDEDRPRWSVGLYTRRSGKPVWEGPPDPALLDVRPTVELDAVRAFRDRFAAALDARALDVEGPLPLRLVTGAPKDETLLRRPPLEGRRIPESGLHDGCAETRARLVCVGLEDGVPVLELPGFDEVELFLAFVEVLGLAAADLPALLLRGYPPPTSPRVRFATLTPDPGVVEVNMAPARSLRELHDDLVVLDDVAKEEGLSPERRHFNGELTDSGGGGHLTFGGPTPRRSPFFQHPMLLPRLLAYLSRHPSLSYVFASRAVGGSGQAVRPDEGARESFEELGVALDRLVRRKPTPSLLWETLAPLLTDRFGNTHRSEVNVEKLWNPWLPHRGQLGLVELRAFRQAHGARHATARAALFRALLAYLATHETPTTLRDWGGVLHDRFALPYYLHLDLQEVLQELERGGFGLDAALAELLFEGPHLVVGEAKTPGLHLGVRRAIEFWPLVGDLSQQGGTTRLVDSSTRRLELLLHGPRLDGAKLGVEVGEEVYLLPLVRHWQRERAVAVFGLRYRVFTPRIGLHPDAKPLDPLRLILATTQGEWSITLHGWKPGGGVYEGLPVDLEDAASRRAERFVVEPLTQPPTFTTPPRQMLSRFSFDSRRR